jgi:hypothetical protein
VQLSRKVVLGVVVALVLVAGGIGGWLLHGSNDNGGSSAAGDSPDGTVKVGVPTIVTPSELQEFASNHNPVYWAGARPGTKLELTLTDKDAIFVRYLPDSAKAGDPKKYLTVGTYGDVDGYDALTAAKSNVADVVHGQNGAVIAVFKKRPLSTYFSFKNAGFQVEVFSPVNGQSKRLTDNGSVTLVGANQ